MEAQEPLVDVAGLADYLKIEKSWIYSRSRNGQIPCIRVGKYLRFRISEVMEWLKNQQEAKNPMRRER